MSHKRLYIAAAIIAAVVVISFIISVPRASSPAQPEQEAAAATPSVAFDHSYKGGRYTISGTVAAPHACSTVAAVATSTGDPATGIVVALTLTESDGLCLQVRTPLEFEVTTDAPADLPISVTVDGKPAPIAP